MPFRFGRGASTNSNSNSNSNGAAAQRGHGGRHAGGRSGRPSSSHSSGSSSTASAAAAPLPAAARTHLASPTQPHLRHYTQSQLQLQALQQQQQQQQQQTQTQTLLPSAASPLGPGGPLSKYRDRSAAVSRIFVLTDRILKDDQQQQQHQQAADAAPAYAYNRRSTSATQLHTLLLACSGVVDVHVATAAILHGARGQPPLDSVFDDPSASPQVRKAVVDCLAAVVTTFSRSPAGYFRWLLDRLRDRDGDRRSVESRLSLLRVLKEVLVPSTERHDFYGFAPAVVADVMAGLVPLLGNLVDGPDSLALLLEILQIVDNEYTDAMAASFVDVMAFLVGLASDAATPLPSATLIWELMVDLWPHWYQHIDYALAILQQLATSMQHQAVALQSLPPVASSEQQQQQQQQQQGQGSNMQGMSPSAYAMAKINADLSTLFAVLRSLFKSLFASNNADLEYPLTAEHPLMGQIAMASQAILASLGNVHSVVNDRPTLRTSFRIMGLLFKTTELPASQIEPACIQLMAHAGTRAIEARNTRDIIGWIEEAKGILDCATEPLREIPLMEMCLFPSKSRLLSDIRIEILGQPHNLDRLLRLLIDVVERFRDPVVSTQQTFVIEPGELLAEASHLLNLMIASTASNAAGTGLHKAGVNGRYAYLQHATLDQMHTLFEMDVQVCAASTHSGLGGYRAPIVFSEFDRMRRLIASHAEFRGSLMGAKSDLVLLTTLPRIAERHNYFLPALLVSPSELEAAPIWPIVRQQFDVLGDVWGSGRFERQVIALHWMRSMVVSVRDKNKMDTDVEQSGVLSLIEAMMGRMLDSCATLADPVLRASVADVFLAYLPSFRLNRRGSHRTPEIMTKILARLDDIDPNVRQAFWRVAVLFDPIDTQMCVSAVDRLVHEPDDAAQTFRRAVMASPAFGTFRPRHFQLVVSYLGLSASLLQPDETVLAEVGLSGQAGEWLPPLFHAAQAPHVLRNSSAPPSAAVILAATLSVESLMFWALWEASRFCILSRLRTPFGGPLQTLEAIENGLRHYQELLRECRSTGASDLEPQQFFTIVTRLRHLLEFVDVLEIQIFNASRGNFSLMPAVPKASMVFLHANRRVCEEWFSRIRLLVVDLSSQVEHDSICIRHGYEAIGDRLGLLAKKAVKDAGAWQRDCATTLIGLSQALRRSKDVDGLVGLARQWRQETSGLRGSLPIAAESVCRWLHVQAVMAEGQLELAANELKAMAAKVPDVEKTVLDMDTRLPNEMLECYAKLGDWSAAQDLLRNNPGLLPPVMTPLTPAAYTATVADAQSPLRAAFKYGLWRLDRPLQTDDAGAPGAASAALPKDLLDLGVTAFAQKQNAQGLMRLFEAPSAQLPDGSAAPSTPLDLEMAWMQSLFGLVPSSDRDRRLGLLVLGQELAHVAHTDSLSDALGTLRIGQARAKDRVRPDTIISPHLPQWMQVLTVIKENETARLGGVSPTSGLPSMPTLAVRSGGGGRGATKRDPDLDEIRGLLADLARKVSNFRLANRLLDARQSNLTASAALQNNYKLARLLYEEGRSRDALLLLLSIVTASSSSGGSGGGSGGGGGVHIDLAGDADVKAKACQLIAEWNRPFRLDVNEPQVRRALDAVLGGSGAGVVLPTSGVQDDWFSFHMLRRGTEISPAFPKAWFAYGGFCYRVARRAVEGLATVGAVSGTATLVGGSGSGGGSDLDAGLVADEVRRLRAVLSDAHRIDLVEPVILGLLRDLGETLREPDVLDWRESVRSTAGPADAAGLIKDVEDVLGAIRRKIFDYFETATTSYFTYLRVYDAGRIEAEASTGGRTQHTKNGDHRRVGDAITTTLRLIRLFTKYGMALKQAFTDGFANTPSTPWVPVIPQLFSRLHHPEPVVRLAIASLLCQIGASAPHLIMYPVIVGSMTENQKSELAQTGYAKILASLRTADAGLVDQVTQWIHELQRVTVLWEELWLHGLDHVQNEVQGRVERLMADIGRIKSNRTLTEPARVEVMRRNAVNVMRPILFTMEKLYAKTVARGATTRHEQRLLEAFGGILETALDELRQTAKFDDPQGLWENFKRIHTMLAKYAQRNRSVLMADVSPYLASLSHSPISMPGVVGGEDADDSDSGGGGGGDGASGGGGGGRVLTVAGCESEILILPTKTKPKKVTFLASNGRRRSYLLKGLEDLHLDERMQQFMVTVNHLLRGDAQTHTRNLHARCFAVVPLGDNYGMIQWIDGASGLFSVYRKWQQREHSALVERQIKKTVPRKAWPVDMLRAVYDELRQETPSDLVARELWSSSQSPTGWLHKSRAFARSAAVMSMVGYVIGLGDRHLDNILVDLERGDVVHIDFNVCFDKGRRLRVPETVPFRLSPNVVGALGPGGSTEGVFRVASEHVFRVMREHREVLLTLLEAFIYDPLVDW
ncbi:hypothetical protein BC831DRAFT_426088, partial [Entophlyctis helioformis]